MCGKFTQRLSWRDVHDLSDIVGKGSSSTDEIVMATPMRMARVINLNESGRRVNSAMRWGFADRRSATPMHRPKHMHARSETIHELPTFADAFAFSRGILLTNTFNEGEELQNGKTKQWTITPRDGKPIAIGVIYERWQTGDDGELLTFVMATTPPNALISRITDRMPAIIQAEQWPLWLGETAATTEEARKILQPFEGDWDMAEQEQPKKKASGGRPGPQESLL